MELSQLIPAFLGDDQGQSTVLLSQIYSPGGSVNLYIDKLGQIRSVDGYTRQNSSAFTTDTGATAAMIRGLYMFRRITGGATTRQLVFTLDDAVNEWELHVSTDLGVTKTLIADLGAGSVGAIPDFATFGDELFIVNGVITPRMWDGTTLTVAGATQLGAPSIASGGLGQLRGHYKYRLVPLLANKVRKPGSIASSALYVEEEEIDLSWTADADTSVVGYELYRTSGSGLDFYLVAWIDGRTTVAYTDTMSDAELIQQPVLAVIAAHGDAPPSGAYFCVPHKGRMWYLRTDANPRRGYWSDPGDPDSVYTDRHYTDFTDAKSLGDVLTGGTGDFEGMIVFWMEKSVWTMSGTGNVVGGYFDYRKKRSNAKAGAVHHRAVARVSAGSVYLGVDGSSNTVSRNMLAYLTPQKDIRLFDGTNDFIISGPKKDTLARLNLTHARKSFCYDDETHGMLVWVFPADASTEPSISVAWNYWHGTWHEWSGTNFGHVVPAESSSASMLIAGEARTATGGLIYQLWLGATQDGTNITATMMTKPIFPPIVEGGPMDLRHIKRAKAAIFLFEKDASPTALSFGVLPHDGADGDTPWVTRTVNGTSRVRIPVRMKEADANPGRFFHGEGWRFKLTSTASTGSWTLKALEHVYDVLKGSTE